MRISILVLTRLAILLLVLTSSAEFAQAQADSPDTIEPLTSEFEVSGFSNMFAGGMGLSPVVPAAGNNILIAWHKGIVPYGDFFTSYWAPMVPFDFQRGVYVSTFDMDGIALGEPIRVDDPEAQGWPSYPIIAADAAGRFVVVWRQSQWSTRGNAEHFIWMRPFDEKGNPLDDGIKLTEETEIFPSLDMAANGEFVIVLGKTEAENLGNFDSEQQSFWLFDANFQPRHDTPIEVDVTVDEAPHSRISAVSMNEQGDLAVVYEESTIFSSWGSSGLRFRTFSRNGIPISEPISLDYAILSDLAIKWLNNDRFLVSWMSGDRYMKEDGYWREYGRNGQPLSEKYHLGNVLGQGGILLIRDTEYAIVWATDSGPVFAQTTPQGQIEQLPFGTPGSAIEHVSHIKVAKITDSEFTAVTNNAIGKLVSVRAQVFSPVATGSSASLESEIAGPCIEDRIATAKLTWSSDADYVEIYIAGPPIEKLFARGRGKGEILTGPWVQQGMVFQLRHHRTGAVLATTTVSLNPDSCPISPVLIDPDPIKVCDPRELSSAEVLWDTTGLSSSGAEIRVNGVDGKLFARSSRLGSATTGKWLRNRMTLYLLKPHTTELLGTTTVSYQQTVCD